MNFLNKSLKLTVAVISFFVIPGCSCDKKDVSMAPETTAVAAPKLMVVNVADVDTYGECHIKGSSQLDFEGVEAAFKNIPHDTAIVTYCANYQCTASGAVAQMLQEMGFTNVKAFEGGIAQWYQKGYPIEGTCVTRKGDVSSYLTAENIKGPDGDEGVTEISIGDLKNEMEQAGLLQQQNGGIAKW